MSTERVDVLVVGAGPAGLAAATELRRRSAGRVLVLDRERQAGGIPRHSDHQGYGLIDLHRPLTGPQYARRMTRAALDSGAELRLETSVVSWAGERRVCTTSAAGVGEIEAAAIVLASGCRERPRSARLVPGTRPAGIFTTGSLQQFVHIHHVPVGRRAVVVGAEHVSFSAVLTLAHAGVRVVALVTEHPRHQTYPPLKLVTTDARGIPILAGQKVSAIKGGRRVEAVEVADVATGAVQTLSCDTVVFTGDWIPDHELARLAGVAIDPGTKGPRVDGALRTSAPGVFAAGNLLHGAETSDIATGEGRHVASAVDDWLATGAWPSGWVRISVADPLTWVTPNAITPGSGALPSRPFVLRVNHFVPRPTVEIRQGTRLLWRGRPTSGFLASFAPWLPGPAVHGALVPGRPVHVPTQWTGDVRAADEPVVISVAEEV